MTHDLLQILENPKHVMIYLYLFKMMLLQHVVHDMISGIITSNVQRESRS